MGALSSYLNRIYFARMALLLFGIVSIVLSFDLLERSDNVLGARGGGVVTLLHYGVLRLPSIASQLMPIAALLAAVLAFGELSRYRELDAMWASGVSPFRIILALFPAAVILIALQFTLDNWAVPKNAEKLRDWGLSYMEDLSSANTENGVWLRSGRDILRLPAEAAQEGRMENLTIFRRSADGMLIERLDAAKARPRGEDWVLENVTRRSVDTAERDFAPKLLWRGKLNLKHIAQLAHDPSELSLGELLEIIDNEAYGQRRTYLYETWLHDRIVSALTPFLMVVLVISLTQAIGKSLAFGWIFVTALALSFIFFVFDRMTLAMGEVGILPAWLAAWAPNLVLASVAGTFLLRQESSRSVPAPAPRPLRST